MFATIDEVSEIAGVSVDNATLLKAQAIIETASGRPEELVTDTTDLIWLKKATAYQCAYMEEDPTTVFEQMNLESVTQGQNKMVIGDKPVWLSPIAQRALGNLSWRRSRMVQAQPYPYRQELWRQEMQDEFMRDRWWNW